MRPFHLGAESKVLDLHGRGHRRLIADGILTGGMAVVAHEDRAEPRVALLVLILEVGALVVVLLEELPLRLLFVRVRLPCPERRVFLRPLLISQAASSIKLRLLPLSGSTLGALAPHALELAQLPRVELLELIHFVIILWQGAELERRVEHPALLLAHCLDEERFGLGLPARSGVALALALGLGRGLQRLPLLDCLTRARCNENWLEQRPPARCCRLVVVVVVVVVGLVRGRTTLVVRRGGGRPAC